jgi:hypothetical protein
MSIPNSIPPKLLMNLPHTKLSDLAQWLPDQWKLRQLQRIANLQRTNLLTFLLCKDAVRGSHSAHG